MDLAKLKDPFPPEAVHWRVGATNQTKTKGMALAYLDARDVMDRLDDVCGPDGWQSRFTAVNGRIVCEIGIDIGDEEAIDRWVWKADGAGDTEHEPEKGGLSDAFKRAAVHWGIGRYLYRMSSPWVEIEQAGKSYKIKPSELQRLNALLTGNAYAISADKPADKPKGKKTPEDFLCAVQVADGEKLAALDGWLREHGAKAFGNDKSLELAKAVTSRAAVLAQEPWNGTNSEPSP